MSDFSGAPRMRIVHDELPYVRADVNFVPVCRYLVGWDVDVHEQGAFVKFASDGSVASVERRVFTP